MKLWWMKVGPWRTTKDTIDRRHLSALPRIWIWGLADQRCRARWMKDCSRSWIASTPTASLSWNTRPARMDSTIAGVPPSSRRSGSETKRWRWLVT